jgi:hypothetical protein
MEKRAMIVPEHHVFPYLPRKLTIGRPAHQVWGAEIIYISMPLRFLCLAAIMDWCDREILA